MYIFAPEDEFSEIIYVFFGGKQNIFSTIFGTKFVVIFTTKNRLTHKEFMQVVTNFQFALARARFHEIYQMSNLQQLSFKCTFG